MATTIKHHDHEGYIEIICSGDIDIDEATSAMEEIVRLGEATGCDLLLANLLEMQHAPDSIDMFSFASDYPANIRTAMILPLNSDFDHDFFENVARNRGRLINSFKHRDEAVHWLTSPP